ncbi:HAD family hydrolase [Aliarcobacter butzleri]|uniref:phosphoglycolate phosphatase n=1 Tax=Aliarcobacter butzleri TaxID=28197 RepID=A0AAP4UY97_9BACT|nr:HAD family hydrolase [Aliarcobacter butzleri]MCG3705088.1 HAD family hydrolase [Aliarcobacter butzleri]MCT7562427.1 HAD family hydrolase [Aliarcobacter butzleri]MCT7643668.1 HAD family hydrolase [Aliarcobacter butzleri]MCT7648671.1 HAD family hydrolase [Aliarcobacter butzleri]MDK2090031.1 HAD family hydrolase [Aliarcobacter butzleri]
MNKIILFDLDGTLIDSTDAIVSTFRFAFKEQGFDFRGNDKNIKDLIGYPLDIMFERLGVSKQKVWDYVDSYKNRYRVISVEQTTLLENAFEAVQLASKIARVSVVTTKTRMYTIPILDNFNITQYFEVITGRENVENPKPHPEPILKTLAQMNYDKNSDEVYMIGDTKLDLICANEAKVNAIGVLCGYSDEEELLNYTNIVKKDALEAIKYISTL